MDLTFLKVYYLHLVLRKNVFPHLPTLPKCIGRSNTNPLSHRAATHIQSSSTLQIKYDMGSTKKRKKAVYNYIIHITWHAGNKSWIL